MKQELLCAICIHTKLGEPNPAITIINGQAVCEPHMGYVQGGVFTRFLIAVKKQDGSLDEADAKPAL